ncbi:MAG: hypothetical protein GY928_05100 [Colwellia sp.]|nr:hypothetical protein [Colwellia sp.]
MISFSIKSSIFNDHWYINGHPPAPQQHEFGLTYHGDIWAGNQKQSSNTFSDSVFDNVTICGGNTGIFGTTQAYTWQTKTSAAYTIL